MQSHEIEEEIQKVMDSFNGATISETDCDTEDGVLEITLKHPKEYKFLKFEIMAPWRIVDDEEIITGSGAILMAEGSKPELSKVVTEVKNLVHDKVLEEYQLDDLQLSLGEGVQIQHFSDYSSSDPEDYNIALHYEDGENTTHFLLGPGSAYISG